MKGGLAALIVLVAGTAAGQIAASAEVEQLYLDPSARGSLLVGNGQTLPGGTFRVSTAIQYSQGHVRTGGSALVLRDRFALHVLGSVGITRWLELSGELPVVVYQQAESASFAVRSSGLGTPFVHARIGILDPPAPVSLWFSLGLGIPIGSPGALGGGGLAFAPRVNVGRNFQRVLLGAELGALIRPVGSFADAAGGSVRAVRREDRVGSQLYLSLGASQLRERLRAEVNLRAFASLSGGKPGLELLFGARYPFLRDEVEVFFLAGPGIGGAPTTPSYRLYAGLAFGTGGPAHPRCSEHVAYSIAECPELDRDADGVLNAVDAAPLEAEDKDGFQDQDGAPDWDNDADGVLDPADRCPDVKGSAEQGGCPGRSEPPEPSEGAEPPEGSQPPRG